MEQIVLLKRGLLLEYLTLSWNVIGVVMVILAAIAARSVALAGFGLDSLIEISLTTQEFLRARCKKASLHFYAAAYAFLHAPGVCFSWSYTRHRITLQDRRLKQSSAEHEQAKETKGGSKGDRQFFI